MSVAEPAVRPALRYKSEFEKVAPEETETTQGLIDAEEDSTQSLRGFIAR